MTHTSPMFTQYHIQADHVPMRADVAMPHWITQSKEQAERLASWLRTQTTKYQNVTIREHTWGHH